MHAWASPLLRSSPTSRAQVNSRVPRGHAGREIIGVPDLIYPHVIPPLDPAVSSRVSDHEAQSPASKRMAPNDDMNVTVRQAGAKLHRQFDCRRLEIAHCSIRRTVFPACLHVGQICNLTRLGQRRS
jgi:hypothetical protein